MGSHQTGHVVLGGEAIRLCLFVLPNAARQVIGHPDVEHSRATGHLGVVSLATHNFPLSILESF